MSFVPVSSTVIDSILFRDAFGTPAMREVFSDRRLIARYIEVEVALARAEARCGVIPSEAAEAIARESRLERIDFDHMRHETDIVGYPILPLVHQLVAMCGEAGRYVHWGATTQDIMDTANVCRCAMRWIWWRPISARCAASWPTWRRSTATPPWPAAPTCSRRCP